MAYTRKIQFSEIDAGGVLYFANYPKIADEARNALFDSVGCGYVELLKKNMCFVVSDCSIKYKKPIKLNAELTLKSKVLYSRPTSISFQTEIKTAETTNSSVTLSLVLIDTQKNRPIKIPKNILGPLNLSPDKP